jgi:DHA2 family multidrug resistance protein-like MFS transporter
VLSMIAGISVVRFVRWFAPHTLTIVGLVLVSVGFWMILLFRHDLTVTAVVVSFIVLELGVGISQTITNDTIVSSVPADKSGAASGVSETAYELGAVVGTATLGTIFTAFYRNNVDVPGGLSAAQTADAAESIGGAVSVAGQLPAAQGEGLLASARVAFDSGIAPTATIAGTLVLIAAAAVAWAFRKRDTQGDDADRPAAAPSPPVAPRPGRGSTALSRQSSRAARRPRSPRADRPRPVGSSADR